MIRTIFRLIRRNVRRPPRAFRLSTLQTCRLILSDFNSIIRRFPFCAAAKFEKYKFPSILAVSKRCVGPGRKPTSSVSPIIVFEIEPLRHFFTVTLSELVHFYPDRLIRLCFPLPGHHWFLRIFNNTFTGKYVFLIPPIFHLLTLIVSFTLIIPPPLPSSLEHSKRMIDLRRD